jgi:RNA polymerase sigma-70 factor (ECF subfamily)
MSEFEWNGPGRFVAWLTTIAENTCREMVRRHVQTQRNSLDREVRMAAPIGRDGSVRELAQVLSAGGPGPSTVLGREERLLRLERALEALVPRYREVLILSLLQEIPTAEIGQRLGLTSSAVCMLRSRALKKLREHFGDTDSFELADRSIAADPPVTPRDVTPERDFPA